MSQVVYAIVLYSIWEQGYIQHDGWHGWYVAGVDLTVTINDIHIIDDIIKLLLKRQKKKPTHTALNT